MVPAFARAPRTWASYGLPHPPSCCSLLMPSRAAVAGHFASIADVSQRKNQRLLCDPGKIAIARWDSPAITSRDDNAHGVSDCSPIPGCFAEPVRWQRTTAA
jgi:hypothetical protein